jgi:hypothetical protein
MSCTSHQALGWSNQIEWDRLGVGHVWEKTKACSVLVGQHEGMRPLGRPSCW